MLCCVKVCCVVLELLLLLQSQLLLLEEGAELDEAKERSETLGSTPSSLSLSARYFGPSRWSGRERRGGGGVRVDASPTAE